MIVSHRHRFIFIRSPKTGSSSIQHALSQVAGPDAIVSQLDYPPRGYQPRNIAPWVTGHFRAVAFQQHFPEWLRDYYTCVFERNPWDKMVSAYWWVKKHRGAPSFKQWLMGADADDHRPHHNTGMYCDDDGRVLVNMIGRFEHLQDDYELICSQVKCKSSPLMRLKSNFRPSDSGHYSTYYDDEAEGFVGEQFKDVIDLCKYTFEKEGGP